MNFLATVAGFILSLVLASAFRIPEGTPNGVYSVHVYPNGTEEHTRLAQRRLPAYALQLRKRQATFYPGPQCYTNEGGELNHGDTDTANNELQSQCGGGANIGYGLDFYSISGCTVAYACNFYTDIGADDDYSTCFSSYSTQANIMITDGCGEYQPGSIEDSVYDIMYGYENYCSSAGSNFCGRGT